MSRLHDLAIAVRAKILHREIEALKRRAQRRMLNRRHVPSAYLVPGYPGIDASVQTFAEPVAAVLWFRVALLLVVFGAGVLFADVVRPAAPAAAPADLVCPLPNDFSQQ